MTEREWAEPRSPEWGWGSPPLTPHPAGLGDFQDLLNKLPWRKDDRRARAERQDRQDAQLDALIAQEAASLHAQAEASKGRVLGALALAGAVVALAAWWRRRR